MRALELIAFLFLLFGFGLLTGKFSNMVRAGTLTPWIFALTGLFGSAFWAIVTKYSTYRLMTLSVLYDIVFGFACVLPMWLASGTPKIMQLVGAGVSLIGLSIMTYFR